MGERCSDGLLEARRVTGSRLQQDAADRRQRGNHLRSTCSTLTLVGLPVLLVYLHASCPYAAAWRILVTRLGESRQRGSARTCALQSADAAHLGALRKAVQAAVEQQAPCVVGDMVADAVPGGAVLAQRQQLHAAVSWSCSNKSLDAKCYSTYLLAVHRHMQSRYEVAVCACVHVCECGYLPQHRSSAARRQRKADHPAQASDCEHSVLQARELHSRAVPGLRTARSSLEVQHDESVMQSRVRTNMKCVTDC